MLHCNWGCSVTTHARLVCLTWKKYSFNFTLHIAYTRFCHLPFLFRIHFYLPILNQTFSLCNWRCINHAHWYENINAFVILIFQFSISFLKWHWLSSIQAKKKTQHFFYRKKTPATDDDDIDLIITTTVVGLWWWWWQ